MRRLTKNIRDKETKNMSFQSDYALLNIGLNVNGVEALTVIDVVNAIGARGVAIKQIAVVESDTENTAVVGISPPLTRNGAAMLAAALRQDAIALWDSSRFFRNRSERRADDMQRAGMLAGPKAEAWGEFDPARFFGFNGRPITSILEPV